MNDSVGEIINKNHSENRKSVKMHKVLSVLSLLGFIISSAKADGAAQPSQAVSDVPQQATQYVQSAPLSESLSVCDTRLFSDR